MMRINFDSRLECSINITPAVASEFRRYLYCDKHWILKVLTDVRMELLA